MELIRLIKGSRAHSKVCQDNSQTTSLLVRVQRTLVGNGYKLEHVQLHNSIAKKTAFLKAKMSTNGISLPYSTMNLIMINSRGHIIFDTFNLN